MSRGADLYVLPSERPRMDVASATDEAQEPEPGVFLTQLLENEHTSVNRFEIEPGASVPLHDHPHEQVGVVTAGELEFRTADGASVTCGPGDVIAFAGDETHAVENRGDTVARGVDIFSPPRSLEWD